MQLGGAVMLLPATRRIPVTFSAPPSEDAPVTASVPATDTASVNSALPATTVAPPARLMVLTPPLVLLLVLVTGGVQPPVLGLDKKPNSQPQVKPPLTNCSLCPASLHVLGQLVSVVLPSCTPW